MNIPRILVVDDSPEKVNAIKTLLAKYPVEPTVVADTVHDACRLMKTERFDLLILDMQVPLRSGEAPRSDGGARLIEALKTNQSLIVPDHIVGLTAYDSLRERFSADLEKELWFLLKYDPASHGWESELAARVEHIVATKASKINVSYGTSLVVLTALHPVELEAVLGVWPELVECRFEGDDSVYYRASVSSGSDSHTVIAVAGPQMGMAASAALGMKVIETFRPVYLCMAGIAAGSKGNFGDILVATQGWDYGSGKLSTPGKGRKTEFAPAPERIPLDPALKSEVEWFRLRMGHRIANLHEEWRLRGAGDSPAQPPEVRLGPLASGAAVVADRNVISHVWKQDRKLVGIEMEAYGVMLAGLHCRAPKPRVLVAKSICDFADDQKGDSHQAYAAFTSARFIREFAEATLFARISSEGLLVKR